MDFQQVSLRFLYKTLPGRLCLKLLTKPAVSQLVGSFMNTRISTLMIDPFLRKTHIEMSDYPKKRYVSYNDFFTRTIKPEKRHTDMIPEHFISPCDCKLSVYPLNEDSNFHIKGSFYTAADLLENENLAKHYHNGYCFIFRLTVDDYHRYYYMDDGEKEENIFIPGELHTVNPIALEYCNIYKRNSREYTILHTKNFGDVVQVEVGAMMVGRIRNHHQKHDFVRGEEKGLFEFGGSTIVILVKKDTLCPISSLLQSTQNGKETVVKMGQWIATQKRGSIPTSNSK